MFGKLPRLANFLICSTSSGLHVSNADSLSLLRVVGVNVEFLFPRECSTVSHPTIPKPCVLPFKKKLLSTKDSFWVAEHFMSAQRTRKTICSGPPGALAKKSVPSEDPLCLVALSVEFLLTQVILVHILEQMPFFFPELKSAK